MAKKYPIYNDKRSRSCFFCIGIGSPVDFFPAEETIKPILPRPTTITKHVIIQPKANSGFLRGQRNIKREHINDKKN